MNNLFAQSRSHWVRYDRYEIKTGKDGKRYITPEKAAKPDIYNPLKESSEMVLEALNVGMLMMNRRSEDVVEKAILAFVTHYGLLGLMTHCPPRRHLWTMRQSICQRITSSRKKAWRQRIILLCSIPSTNWMW